MRRCKWFSGWWKSGHNRLTQWTTSVTHHWHMQRNVVALVFVLLHGWKVKSGGLPATIANDWRSLVPVIVELYHILSMSSCIMHSIHKLVHCYFAFLTTWLLSKNKMHGFDCVKSYTIANQLFRRPRWACAVFVCLFGCIVEKTLIAHSNAKDIPRTNVR